MAALLCTANVPQHLTEQMHAVLSSCQSHGLVICCRIAVGLLHVRGKNLRAAC